MLLCFFFPCLTSVVRSIMSIEVSFDIYITYTKIHIKVLSFSLSVSFFFLIFNPLKTEMGMWRLTKPYLYLVLN